MNQSKQHRSNPFPRFCGMIGAGLRGANHSAKLRLGPLTIEEALAHNSCAGYIATSSEMPIWFSAGFTMPCGWLTVHKAKLVRDSACFAFCSVGVGPFHFLSIAPPSPEAAAGEALEAEETKKRTPKRNSRKAENCRRQQRNNWRCTYLMRPKRPQPMQARKSKTLGMPPTAPEAETPNEAHPDTGERPAEYQTRTTSGRTAENADERKTTEPTLEDSETSYPCLQPCPYRAGLLAFACAAGLLQWKGLNPLGLFDPSLGGSVSAANVQGEELFAGLVPEGRAPQAFRILHIQFFPKCAHRVQRRSKFLALCVGIICTMPNMMRAGF